VAPSFVIIDVYGLLILPQRKAAKGVARMAKGIWRYTMTAQEQKLWENTDLKGWRVAMEAYVEDEARDRGFSKYAIINRTNLVVAENVVKALPVPVGAAN
jgi:hypothetical protein